MCQTPLTVVADSTGVEGQQISHCKHNCKDLEGSPERVEDFQRGEPKIMALTLLYFITLGWTPCQMLQFADLLTIIRPGAKASTLVTENCVTALCRWSVSGKQ